MIKSKYMCHALKEARYADAEGEVPVGAVISDPASGEIIAVARNATRALNDCTAHAEIIVIREACKLLGQERLAGLDLHVTLEPCAMCAGAIAHARIGRLYFGAEDEKSGAVYHGARVFDQPQSHHKPEIYDGIEAEEAKNLLKAFFERLR